MSNAHLRNITNSFQDVRLASLSSWRQANEFVPRDRGGPYVVTQEGYNPEDLHMRPDEFVLGRSGKWLPLAQFYRMPVAERRAEFVFGTAAEVMQVMGNLPSKAEIMRPSQMDKTDAETAADADGLEAAFRAARSESHTR